MVLVESVAFHHDAQGLPDHLLAIPSVGPSFGRMLDQIALLKPHRFPTAMMLPCADPRDAKGLEYGAREFVDKSGVPLILYLKDEPNFGTGACTQGTDRTDCGSIAWMRNQTDACATSFNGICEEPGHGNGSCAPRTDRSDCHGRTRPR